jgi:nitrite reductase/ring-hydroxylating ferredoxin subunit
MAWRKVAVLTELVPGRVREVDTPGAALALFSLNGRIHATQAVCPHQFAWLAQGTVEDDRVYCPRHEGCFHIPTGVQLGGPPCPPLRVYRTRVDGGDVLVDLP